MSKDNFAIPVCEEHLCQFEVFYDPDDDREYYDCPECHKEWIEELHEVDDEQQ